MPFSPIFEFNVYPPDFDFRKLKILRPCSSTIPIYERNAVAMIWFLLLDPTHSECAGTITATLNRKIQKATVLG